jgi:uncharacterized membrane protein YbhN (UPF0104 family)
MLPEFMKRLWSSHSKTILLLIRLMGTIVSTTLFIWLISSQKWGVVLNKATGIAIWTFFLYLGLYLFSYGFNNLRWCILLWTQGVKISFWRAYSLSWAGIFASNFLPGTIGGDGFRMMAMHRYIGRTTISVGSVILDRIINMIAMACLIPLPLIIFGSSLLLQGQLLPEGKSHPIGLLPAGAVCHAAPKGWLAATVIPSGLQKLFEKYFPKIVAAVRLWGSKPWTFVYAFLAAWPSNLLPMAATYLIARQLGMNVTYWQVIGIQTVTYFLSVLPISINGYGLREVAFTTLYTALGSTLEQASTLALVTRFLNVLSSLPGAIWLTSSVTGVAGMDKKIEA